MTAGNRIRALMLAATLGSCSLWAPVEYLAPADPATENRPVTVKVEFQGGDQIADFRLRRAIEDRLFDLSRSPDSAGVLQDAAFDLEDRYRRDGYADVDVRAWRERLRDARGKPWIRAVFRIRARRRHVVEQLELVGAEQLAPGDPEDDSTVTATDLQKLWLRRTSSFFGFGPPLFVMSDLSGLADSMELLLRSQGYLNAEVDPPELDFGDPAEDGADVPVRVRIAMNPGRQYQVGDCRLVGRALAALPDRERPAPPRGVATMRAIESWRAAVLAALRNRGHADATVNIELTRNAARGTVDATIDAIPGPRATIAELHISPLDATDEGVVRDRLEFRTGQGFDRSAVDESLRQLYLSGLFRSVEIEHEWLEPPETAADDEVLPVRLDVDVEEEDTRQIELLAGYGSYERIRGKVRLEEANLFGSGRGLVTEARVSTRGERGLVTISDPRAFGSDITVSLSADAYRRQEPAFEDNAWGGTLAAARDVARRMTARVGYTARLHTGNNIDVTTTLDSTVDSYTEGNLFGELRYDDRDGLIYPRDGWLVNFRVDTNQPELGATVEFWRARISASTWLELSERLVLAMRADTGALWPGEGSQRVPLQERFFNGGENTVRSFREAQLGPKDANGDPTGGEFRNLINVEFRAGLTESFELSVFGDAGNVGSQIQDYGLGDLRYAIGAGLRWVLPIGPVRLDTAWNPDRRSGDREWTAHLSVGYPF